MPAIPAVCRKCGVIFSSGMVIENSWNVTIGGGTVSPCPTPGCSGVGDIIDGKFSAYGPVLTLLSGSQFSIDTLQRLSSILAKAVEEKRSPEEVKQEIAAIPGFGKELLRLLPDGREAFHMFISSVLIPLLMYFILNSLNADREDEGKSPPVNNTATEQLHQEREYFNSESQPSRNQPCTCDSGKKYKHCCGSDGLSPAERLLRDLQNSRKNPDYGAGGYRT